MSAKLGRFVLVSCSEKKREQQALDKEIRGTPGFTCRDREERGNKDVWRGKANGIEMNVNKRKEDLKEIMNSYNQFISEKAGNYSMKYLRNLSDLLFKTKKIDYVTERAILVKSTAALSKGYRRQIRYFNPSTKKKPISITPYIKEAWRASMNQRPFKTECYLSSPNQGNAYDDSDSNENDVQFKEPDIQYEKNAINYERLLYEKIRKQWKFYSAPRRPKATSANFNANATSFAFNSNSVPFRPDNIDKLLQFSSSRYPAKEHFFKVLNIRKEGKFSPMSTAYSSFPPFSKSCLTTND